MGKNTCVEYFYNFTKLFLKDINKNIVTVTVTTEKVKLSIMMLSFTLEILCLYVPTGSFHILM